MSHDQDQERRRADSSVMPRTSAAPAAPGRMSSSAELRRPENPEPSSLAQPKAVQPKAAEGGAAEPSWIAGARAYNSAHGHLVSEFNELTLQACLSDHGQLDPQKVKDWQTREGLLADGKVGPQTVGAARSGRAAGNARWAKARAFNAARPELVAQFNDLTAYLCFDFDSNELVPEQVAKWQAKHGEPPDGMVSTDTIAAAQAKTSGAIS